MGVSRRRDRGRAATDSESASDSSGSDDFDVRGRGRGRGPGRGTILTPTTPRRRGDGGGGTTPRRRGAVRLLTMRTNLARRGSVRGTIARGRGRSPAAGRSRRRGSSRSRSRSIGAGGGALGSSCDRFADAGSRGDSDGFGSDCHSPHSPSKRPERTLAFPSLPSFGRGRRNGGGGGDYGGDDASGIELGAVRGRGGGSRGSRGSGRKPPSPGAFRAHPWILPPYLKLAPRIDLWGALAASSAAALASVGRIKFEARGAFAPAVDYALSAAAIGLALSLGIAAGTRHGPLRTALTRPLFPLGSAAFLPGLRLTVELLVLTVLAILWTAALPIVANGSGRVGGEVPLAVVGTDIWNANLYYSTWASFLLSTYLWVEVFTLHDRRGTLKVDSSGPSRRPQASNVFTKRWTLLFLASLVLMSASIVTYISPSCEGTIMKQTPYCVRALVGILVGGVLQALIVLGVAVLYRLSNMGPGSLRYGLNSQLQRGRPRARGLDAVCGAAALLSLAAQGTSAGLITGAAGGGPGNVAGALYFGSWLAFALAFETCLRYLELFGTGGGAAAPPLPCSVGGTGSRDTVTVYDDEEDEEESLMMLGAEEEEEEEEDDDFHGDVETQASRNLREDLDANSYVFSYSIKNQEQQPATASIASWRRQPTATASVASSRRQLTGSVASRRTAVSVASRSRYDALTGSCHRGGGVEPEEYLEEREVRPARRAGRSPRSGGSTRSRRSKGSGASRRKSRSRTPTNPRTSDASMVGSIDARSVSNADPDGDLKRIPSKYNASFGAGPEESDRGTSGEESGDDYFDALAGGVRSYAVRTYGRGRTIDMVGSIDARSADPDGILERNPSGYKASFGAGPEGSDFEMLGDKSGDDYFDADRQEAKPYAGGRPSEDPESAVPKMSFTSFHMDQVEKLDETPSRRSQPRARQVPPSRDPSAGSGGVDPALLRHSTATDLSPLQEASDEKESPKSGTSGEVNSESSSSEECPPTDEEGPPTVEGEEEEAEQLQRQHRQPQPQQQREVGDNLRAMQGIMRSMQQADRSKKSSSSSKKGSVGTSTRSRSGSRGGLSGLSPGMGQGSGRGGQASRNSRQSRHSSAATSRNTMNSFASSRDNRSRGKSTENTILTDRSGHDESSGAIRQQRFNQLGSRRSARSLRSASTISSRGVSMTSAIMTDDDESGSNPPPTISDGLSSKGDLSGYSAFSPKRSGSASRGVGNRGPGSRLPPPPPFRRSPADAQDLADAASEYSSSAPVRSINTHKGSSGDDSIVSDPTLDAGLDQSPTPPVKPRVKPPPPPRREKKPDSTAVHRSSSSTESYDKKYSDDTERCSIVSDENPSSQEGSGGRVVDNIVAAALAYAEKTHEVAPFPGVSSGTAPPPRAHKSKSMPHRPEKKRVLRDLHASAKTEESSSIHSFYTDGEVVGGRNRGGRSGGGSGGGGEPSPYAPQPHEAAPVEDLVAKALHQAQGQLDGTQCEAHNEQDGTVPSSLGMSEQGWSTGTGTSKSVGSMYSDDGSEYMTQGVDLHYDC